MTLLPRSPQNRSSSPMPLSSISQGKDTTDGCKATYPQQIVTVLKKGTQGPDRNCNKRAMDVVVLRRLGLRQSGMTAFT